MHELPTGQVTMLFVDVESSTVLLEPLGSASYAATRIDGYASRRGLR